MAQESVPARALSPAWPSRRQVVFGAASSGLIAGDITPKGLQAAENHPSLRALAEAKGLRFGTAFGMKDLADPRMRALARAECGLLVCENEHKWPATQPQPNRFDFDQGDQITDFARASGIAMRGHNLYWAHADWQPAWLKTYDFGAAPIAAAQALMTRHIQTVCRHYAGTISSWDVVNEAIDERNGALRATPLGRHLGEAQIDLAFHAAHEALPNAQLVYNDFMSWGDDGAAHRTGVLNLLERLKGRGVPVHALGLQSHLRARVGQSYLASEARNWRYFLTRVTDLGLGLLVTELDVDDTDLPGDVVARDRGVSDLTRAYLDLVLSYPQVTDILTWGLVDHHSWLQGRWLRPDRLPKRPLPFDQNYRAKPMRAAIAAAIGAATPRRAVL